MRPMIAPKGYSLNANTHAGESADAAMAFVRYMTSDDVQRRLVDELRMLPGAPLGVETIRSSRPIPRCRASLAQLENGRLMPVATELRAVWDAHAAAATRRCWAARRRPPRPPPQMQRDAAREDRTDAPRDRRPAGRSPCSKSLGLAAARRLARLAAPQLRRASCRDWRRNRIAYLFALPAVVAIFAVIVFPFFYNIVLSLSNMSLTHFHDWQVVGLQNYAEVLTDPKLWGRGACS